MTRYQIDSSWWRRANTDGDTVVAGSPLKIFRFSSAARSVLEAIEKRDEISVAATNTLHRLIDAGAIHPILESIKTSLQPSDVTVVIPVHNEDVLRLNALISKLSAAHEVLLIDDGSTIPLADINGARVIRREVAGGPAAARNTAIDFVTSSITFFLDADTSLADDSWTKLLAHFEDSSVGVVAPRIASEPGTTLLHRYEASESPLDLGSEPARIRKNSRVSYVPTAALMIRTDLLREHRGFDESLRYGEDVDLVWRLLEADVVCRYEPAVTVHHSPRASLLDAWKQRVSYGSAAAPLDQRHRGAATPLRINRWSAGAWGTLASGYPLIGLIIGAASTVALERKISSQPDSRQLALRLAGRGNIHAGRVIAQAMTRTWWPIALLLSLCSRRARRVTCAAIVLPSLMSWFTKKPKVDPVSYCALKLADDVAYGTGVWKGVIATRDLGALTPKFD
ncbi:MAG: mycofactocin system glycosyltransferase [Actinomycetota bacterium]